MANGITLEKVGQRIYFRGNTFAAKDRIKSLGGHWDADARAWWIGAKKEGEARQLLAELAAGPVEATPASARAAETIGLNAGTPAAIVADALEDAGQAQTAAAVRKSETQEELDRARVYAQVEYKGRRYYVVAEQRGPDGLPIRCRLTTLDGMAPFWVDCAVCNLIRTYEGREVWDGRRYSGKTRTEYQTIGSLRRFRDRQKNPDTRRVQCPECDAWHNADEACHECGGC